MRDRFVSNFRLRFVGGPEGGPGGCFCFRFLGTALFSRIRFFGMRSLFWGAFWASIFFNGTSNSPTSFSLWPSSSSMLLEDFLKYLRQMWRMTSIIVFDNVKLNYLTKQARRLKLEDRIWGLKWKKRSFWPILRGKTLFFKKRSKSTRQTHFFKMSQNSFR